MTKESALALVGVDVADEFGLAEWERAFVLEYHSGENAGNATRSLLKVRPQYTYDRASAEASVLLKKSRVAEYLTRLREESLKQFRKGIIALVPRALSILEEALRSESWSLRKWATEIVLDRGLGKPVQPTEIDVGNRLDSLIKQIASRRTNRNNGTREIRSDNGTETTQELPVSVEVEVGEGTTEYEGVDTDVGE